MPTFFGLYAKLYWQFCQNSTLRVHRIVFMGSIFFEKKHFPFVFHILSRKFSSFRQKNSSTVIKTALFSRFFNRINANFLFGLHANFFRLVCQNCTLRVQRNVSRGCNFFDKKTFSKLYLGGNFSGFWQNFSSTVVGTALVPRFFNRTYANFSRTLC